MNRVEKGDAFTMPVSALGMDEEIWGPDAGEFRPERWDDMPEVVKKIPSVWGNGLTFSAGPHACIGYRFAILE